MSQKARILVIGHIIDRMPNGWTFDCQHLNIPALVINDEPLFAGYTIQELQEISDDFWGGMVNANI